MEWSLRDGNSPAESRGEAPVMDLGTKTAEAEAFCIFGHHILMLGCIKCRQRNALTSRKYLLYCLGVEGLCRSLRLMSRD